MAVLGGVLNPKPPSEPGKRLAASLVSSAPGQTKTVLSSVKNDTYRKREGGGNN